MTDPPGPIPTLTPEPAGAAIAGPAGSGSFAIEGEQVLAVGRDRRSIEHLRLGGEEFGGSWAADLGAVATVLRHPGMIRREWVGPSGTVIETLLAHPSLPLLLAQWELPDGTARPFLRIGTGNGSAAWTEAVEDNLAADGDDDRGGAGAPRTLAFRVGERVHALAVTPGASLALDPSEGVVLVAGSGPTTLLLAGGAPERVGTTLRAGAHLQALARRVAGADLEDGLSLRTGVAEVDEGLEWARWRLRGMCGRGHTASVPHLFDGLAAASVGDQPAAEAVLGVLEERDPALAGLLAAELALGWGSVRRAASTAQRLLDGAGARSSSGASTDAWSGSDLTAVACDRLALALDGGAPPDLVATLRAAAARAPEPGGGRSLPMAGRASEPATLGAWTTALLQGRPDPSTPSLGMGPFPDFTSEPDEAWSAWRRSVAEGLAAGPAGPGSWDDPLGAPGPTVGRTASLLLQLTKGVLGLAPDAPKGRVEIAPRLPAHLTRFRAEGITVGGARLALELERDGGTHRWRVEPTFASVPVLAVLELSMVGAVRAVHLDGERAELDVRPGAGRSVVPVQLPIDGVRTVEIEVADYPSSTSM